VLRAIVGPVTAVHITIGSIAIALNAAAALWGAVCWRRRVPSPWFWRLLRAGQGFVVLEALIGGVLLLLGDEVSELHLIYGLLPIGVAFMAEQLRISAAQMILDKRGFTSTREVGALPESEQHAIVVAVVRREIGVMSLAAFVSLVLIIRAAMVVH
jgi:hypothetical protein